MRIIGIVAVLLALCLFASNTKPSINVVKNKTLIDKVVDREAMSKQQHKKFMSLYNRAYTLAATKYGKKDLERATGCILAHNAYHFRYNAKFENLLFRKPPKLLNYLNKHCQDSLTQNLLKDMEDSIVVYNLIMSDGNKTGEPKVYKTKK